MTHRNCFLKVFCDDVQNEVQCVWVFVENARKMEVKSNSNFFWKEPKYNGWLVHYQNNYWMEFYEILSRYSCSHRIKPHGLVPSWLFLQRHEVAIFLNHKPLGFFRFWFSIFLMVLFNGTSSGFLSSLLCVSCLLCLLGSVCNVGGK